MAGFADEVRQPRIISIDDDQRLFNLARGYWVYDEMLGCLRRTGWVRFAPGFKSGLYGHPRHGYCIKILGMGVGENPQYFCERGYYLEHEHRMLESFRAGGFDFGPRPLPCEDAISFLEKAGGVSRAQAEMRVRRHDVLVMEFIPGVPLAMQVGRGISYQSALTRYDAAVLEQMLAALEHLRDRLILANKAGYLHNDPMPPNLLLSMTDSKTIVARLVDFELAQNLGMDSPAYVNNSVAELYRERNVPQEPGTGRHAKTLDEHLMDESIRVAKIALEIARRGQNSRFGWLKPKGMSWTVPFLGFGFEFGLPGEGGRTADGR